MAKNNVNKAYWAPLWHIYQPPVQTKEWLLKIANESYRKIIQVYLKHPKAKLTLNINASLTLLLVKHNLLDIIEGFKKLAKRNQLEFVSTTAYHAICPLLPEEEIIHQIKLNDKINKKYFGKYYKPKGVWLPEMAYNKNVIKAVVKAGYEWVPLAGVASNGRWSNKNYSVVNDDEYSLKIIFRDDINSLNIAFGKVDGNFVDELKNKKGTFCFTAMDGETIGHHVKDMDLFLDKTLTEIEKDKELETITVSKIFELFSSNGLIEAFPSSWSTTFDDIQSENYFPLWLEKNKEPFRTVHKLAWEHLYLLINTLKDASDKARSEYSRNLVEEARSLLDQGEHSCMFWWFTRDDWHRSESRFLSGIELQNKAFIKILKAINKDEEIESNIDKAEKLREMIFENLNNGVAV